MDFRPSRAIPALCMAALLCGAAHAHEPYMDCFDTGDGKVTCRGGYVDGSPPEAGDRILVRDGAGKTVEEGRFDPDGAYTFEPPGPGYSAIFAGTEMGHTVRVRAADVIR